MGCGMHACMADGKVLRRYARIVVSVNWPERMPQQKRWREIKLYFWSEFFGLSDGSEMLGCYRCVVVD